MGLTTTTNIHADAKTEIHRGMPGEAAIGGWLTIRGGGSEMNLFPPFGITNTVDFWRYLSNVAADMATYCEVEERKGK